MENKAVFFMAHLSNDQLGIIRLCHALNQPTLKLKKTSSFFGIIDFCSTLKEPRGQRLKRHTWYMQVSSDQLKAPGHVIGDDKLSVYLDVFFCVFFYFLP